MSPLELVDDRFDKLAEGIAAERRRALDAQQARDRADEARAESLAAAFVGVGAAHNKLAASVTAATDGIATLVASQIETRDEVRAMRGSVAELMADFTKRTRAPVIGALAGASGGYVVVEALKLLAEVLR